MPLTLHPDDLYDMAEAESDRCTSPSGRHEWVEQGACDDDHEGEGRMYCLWCQADGDA